MVSATLGVGGVLVGVIVGFSLATALFRGYVRQFEELHQADADRPAAAATPVAALPSDTPPTHRPRGRTARTARAPRRQRPAVTNAPPAPSATAPTDDITLPRDIVEQLYAQLARLEVLERRDAMRLVRRTDRITH